MCCRFRRHVLGVHLVNEKTGSFDPILSYGYAKDLVAAYINSWGVIVQASLFVSWQKTMKYSVAGETITIAGLLFRWSRFADYLVYQRCA